MVNVPSRFPTNTYVYVYCVVCSVWPFAMEIEVLEPMLGPPIKSNFPKSESNTVPFSFVVTVYWNCWFITTSAGAFAVQTDSSWALVIYNVPNKNSETNNRIFLFILLIFTLAITQKQCHYCATFDFVMPASITNNL